jgi:glutamate/aspartate transport system substrate-binding protein
VVEAVRDRLQMPDLEVRFVGVSSTTRLPLLSTGAIDLECGVTTNTVDRQRFAAFSLTTFVATTRMMVKKGSQVRGIDDLRGRTVVSTLATTSMQYLVNLNQTHKLDMRILGGPENADALRLLRNDQAIALVMDDVLLRSLLAGAPEADDYSIGEDALTVEPYSIGLPRNDAVFKQLVDGVIIDIFKRGDLHGLYRRWFQSPIAPRGVNLQMPMSEQLQRLMRQPTDSPDPLAYH